MPQVRIHRSRPRFGYKRILILLRRQGHKIGKDKVYRIYREEGLQVRTKRRKLRLLTVVDYFSRESVAIEAGYTLRAADVIRTLTRLRVSRGLPRIIPVGNGSEFSGNDLDRFAHERGLQ